MPIMSRPAAFQARLEALSIPISGISNAGPPYPAGITVNYLPSATPEQIALGEAEKEAFDWRPRRFLSRTALATILASLTQAQQNALLRRVVCDWVMEHEAVVIAALAELGVNLPYDEVVP